MRYSGWRLPFSGLVLSVLPGIAASPQETPRLETRMVHIDGHAMRVQIGGFKSRRPGSPAVVFEAGATNALEAWGDVLAQVAASAPVVAYDRAGLGRSEWDGVTPRPRHVAARLRKLLQQIGVHPPYVLVGHSWGGMLARYFAGYHPTEVAGLVLVDPAPMVTRSLVDNLTPFNAVGAGRAGFDAFWSAFAALFARSSPAIREEFAVFSGLLTEDLANRDLRPMSEIPLVVLAAGKYMPMPASVQLPYDPRAQFEADLRYRLGAFQEWTLGSSRGTLVVAREAGHLVQRDDPALVVWAVRRVLSKIARP